MQKILEKQRMSRSWRIVWRTEFRWTVQDSINIFSTTYTLNLSLSHSCHSNSRSTHQIYKTRHWFSDFDSVFNFIKHFVQNTTHSSLCNTHKSLDFFVKHNQSKHHSNSSLTPHMCFTDHQPINKHTSTQLHMLDVFLFCRTVQYCIHNHTWLQ